MKHLSNELSFIKGYCEGLDLSSASNEGKTIVKICDLLSNILERIDALEESNDNLTEYLEILEENMCSCGEDCTCSSSDDTNDESCLELNSINVECPFCTAFFTLNEHDLYSEDDILCPSCNTAVYTSQCTEDFAELSKCIYDEITK